MIRRHPDRIDPKRKNVIGHRKRQFADATYKQQEYPHRLNLYELPPTAEITLEQFEQWAIDRLRVLAELEACSFRNMTAAETAAHMGRLLHAHLPLRSNSSSSAGAADAQLALERRKDHYSHFILRLAFSSTDDLRRRFARLETALFRLRFQTDDARERAAFVAAMDVAWEAVGDDERRELQPLLQHAGDDDGPLFKVDWETVPELVEGRRVLVRGGKAYVPAREQTSMVLAEFTARLEKGLDLTSRALPRLDEDDRLTPILAHLSKSFTAPDSTLSDADGGGGGGGLLATPTASSVNGLSVHFPLCMRHLHDTLRRTAHLRHYGRLQYTLFLKALGLPLDECLRFWRASFRLMTDADFARDHRYNFRHAYGDVGGDANRRGRGHPALSCQRILTDRAPGPGDAHGCPYRHFAPDALAASLRATLDPRALEPDLLARVADDVAARRFHIACNRVFDASHRPEIARRKARGEWTADDAAVIVHPNTWFKRSYLLKRGAAAAPTGDEAGAGGAMEEGGGEEEAEAEA